MSNVIDLSEHKEHCVEELICIKCCHRWIGVLPYLTPLKNLECPGCKKQGFVISTGEVLEIFNDEP